LVLDAAQRPVLHGRDGFSQKGLQEGNASHYYSLTRMETTGEIQLGRDSFTVSGLSWMDHEFGTTFLEPSQQGWDWFSLQLDDGTDFMVYMLRQQDGASDSHSSGTLILPDAQPIILGSTDVVLSPGRTWESSSSGARYPVEWTIQVPDQDLHLEVLAAVDSQELHTEQSTGVTYWEGAVWAEGTRAGQPITGRGFLEMTGYSGRPMSEVLR
jgi:predicted secreted hydrolase